MRGDGKRGAGHKPPQATAPILDPTELAVRYRYRRADRSRTKRRPLSVFWRVGERLDLPDLPRPADRGVVGLGDVGSLALVEIDDAAHLERLGQDAGVDLSVDST